MLRFLPLVISFVLCSGNAANNAFVMIQAQSAATSAALSPCCLSRYRIHIHTPTQTSPLQSASSWLQPSPPGDSRFLARKQAAVLRCGARVYLPGPRCGRDAGAGFAIPLVFAAQPKGSKTLSVGFFGSAPCVVGGRGIRCWGFRKMSFGPASTGRTRPFQASGNILTTGLYDGLESLPTGR
jgi:hypothetical protein